MSDTSLNRLLDTVWAQIEQGVTDRNHPCRYPTLATMGTEGPEARTLVLRQADRANGRIDLFTDGAAPKAAQIIADARVALHVWLPKPRLQIRMRAQATLAPGDPDLFAQLPKEAQENYFGAVPGSELGDHGAPVADSPRFMMISCQVNGFDILDLNTPHRRARYVRTSATDPEWRGQWIAP